MSYSIPFEIQIEIVKWLPVRSLMRFRSVSKQWKSLIDTSRFVTDYNLRQNQAQLFILYQHPSEYVRKFVSIVDDDNFSHHRYDMTATVPNSVKLIERKLVGSSQGLMCFYRYSLAVIWNPSIRKSVVIDVPNVTFCRCRTFVGFGVCPKTSDPKLVKITCPVVWETETWQVQIFSLSLGFWRSRSFSTICNLICKSFELSLSHECVDGFIYWCAYNKVEQIWVTISFDMTSEEFGVTYLLDCLTHSRFVYMSKLRESLVLFGYNFKAGKDTYDVWMTEGGRWCYKIVYKAFHHQLTL